MPTGVSSLYYPEQHPPERKLELGNSYFLTRLHDAQAFFEAGWLVEPGVLIFSSSVESSFQPGSATQSLHHITTLKKKIPCHLGITANLTDWLPARADDTVKITLKYTVVQDSPFKDIVEKMAQLNLSAKVSVVRPDWAVAVKVSEIAGRLLSFLFQEGSQHEIFPLKMDLNLSTLKTGYHAVIGSHTDEDWPRVLRIDNNGRLTDRNGNQLEKLSYAVIEVITLPRRGRESARDEAWWELLQTGKEQVLDTYPENDQERRKILQEWCKTLAQVRVLARKDRGYLLEEVKEIIRAAQIEVEQKLLPRTELESTSIKELPEAWQDVLGVHTEKELRESVRDYQDALAASQQLIEKYNL